MICMHDIAVRILLTEGHGFKGRQQNAHNIPSETFPDSLRSVLTSKRYSFEGGTQDNQHGDHSYVSRDLHILRKCVAD